MGKIKTNISNVARKSAPLCSSFDKLRMNRVGYPGNLPIHPFILSLSKGGRLSYRIS